MILYSFDSPFRGLSICYWMLCFGLVLMELLFFKSTITLEIDKFLLFSNQGNAATLQITSTEKFIHLKGGTMFKPFS